MLKKKLSIILAVLIAAGAVSACAGSNGQDKNEINDNTSVSSDTETAEDNDNRETAENETDGSSRNAENSSASQDNSTAPDSSVSGASQSDPVSSALSDSSQQTGQGSTPAASGQSSRQTSSVNPGQSSRAASQSGTADSGSSAMQSSSQASQSKSNPGSSGTKSENSRTQTQKNTSQTANTNNSKNTNEASSRSGGNNQSSTTNNSSKTNNSSSKANNNSSPGSTTTNSNKNSQSSDNSKSTSETGSKSSSKAVNVSVGDNNLYNSIFNLANKIQVQLTVSQDEMNKLQADYNKYRRLNSKSPIYRKASLTITVNGQKYSMDEVGIRLKGNMSLSPVYDKNGNLNLSHYKLSFNETFDDKDHYGSEAKVWASKEERKARKNRRFATLKKMDLKWNSCYDDTFVREIYAAKMFRDNGVIVQNIGLANTIFNGNNYGVMKIYEPVDEIMLSRFLPQSALGGDLYKCGWTMKPCNYVQSQLTYGVDDKDKNDKFNYNLKTNEKTSDHSSLKKLLSVLASVPDKNSYSSVIDTGYFANFLAASYFAGDPDDMRNNYNNHYVYFRKDNGKAIFIPYDNDRTLGLTYGYNPDGTGMTKPSPYSDMASGARQRQANPLINYGILGSRAYIKSEYTAALKRIAGSGILNEAGFNAYYRLAASNYQSVVTPSVSFANQAQAFKFSLDGKYSASDRRNMSFADFSERILKTYNANVS